MKTSAKKGLRLKKEALRQLSTPGLGVVRGGGTTGLIKFQLGDSDCCSTGCE